MNMRWRPHWIHTFRTSCWLKTRAAATSRSFFTLKKVDTKLDDINNIWISTVEWPPLQSHLLLSKVCKNSQWLWGKRVRVLSQLPFSRSSLNCQVYHLFNSNIAYCKYCTILHCKIITKFCGITSCFINYYLFSTALNCSHWYFKPNQNVSYA